MGRRDFDDNKPGKIFDGKVNAKLGSKKRPAVVTVQNKTRAKEIAAKFKENGWEYKIEIKPDKPEDIFELKQLLNPPKPKKSKKKAGRNDPCPCGSGKKYKKCCGK